MFNSDNKAIPVAWVIAPRFASEATVRWMRALYNRVHTKDPTWKLAGFIVDDPLTDIPAIRFSSEFLILNYINLIIIIFKIDILARFGHAFNC